jgi:chromosome partitioning protein
MTTIAIATHKGGAGKTVTAMALAAGLARTGARALLVDLDPQAHSTIGLGVDAHGTTITDTLQAAAASRLAPPDTYPVTDRLDLVASDIGLERVQHLLYMRPRREQILAGLLRPLAAAYDVCVLDCPPSLGVLTENAIAAADAVLVPCQMEARATDGLVDLLELVQTLKGETFDRWRIVRTRVDGRKTQTNAAIEAALRTHYEAHILAELIPASEPLNQAQIARRDIFRHAPTSAGAVAYGALCARLCVWLAPWPAAAAPAGVEAS